MGTIVVGTGLAIILLLIIRKMIRDKKNGKTCCSGNCGNCKGCH